MNDLDPEADLLKPVEAAAIMRCCLQTVYGHIARGYLRAVHVGPARRVRISREAVREWLNPQPIPVSVNPPTPNQRQRAQSKAHRDAVRKCQEMGV